MNSVLLLVFEYFKIGCFAVGGGYTTIPFLYYLTEKYNWFDISEITQMIAVSNLTPGPIGINMATFVGLKVDGVLGASLATLAFLFPSFIIVVLLSKFLRKNSNSECVKNIMYGLRPAAIALIAVAVWKILNSTVLHLPLFFKTHNFADLISLKSVILLAVFGVIGLKLRKKPMLLIAVAVVLGLFVRV